MAHYCKTYEVNELIEYEDISNIIDNYKKFLKNNINLLPNNFNDTLEFFSDIENVWDIKDENLYNNDILDSYTGSESSSSETENNNEINLSNDNNNNKGGGDNDHKDNSKDSNSPPKKNKKNKKFKKNDKKSKSKKKIIIVIIIIFWKLLIK